MSQATLTLANTTVAGFNFLALMISAFLVNRLASALIVVGVVILFFALRPLTRAARRRSKASNVANIDFVSSVAESVTLAQEVRTFDVGERLIERVDARIQQASDLTMRTRLLGQIMPTLYQNIAIALVLVGMGGVYLAGSSGVADLGAVVLILVRALSYSQQMQSSYHSLVETGPYLEELQERQALYEASFSPEGGVEVDHIGRMRFEDVWFSYRAGEPVLKGVTFDVEPGEAVGIVGPVRQRQVHDGAAAAAPAEPGRRTRSRSTASTPPTSRSTRGTAAWRSSPRSPACSGARWPTTSASSATT